MEWTKGIACAGGLVGMRNRCVVVSVHPGVCGVDVAVSVVVVVVVSAIV